MFDRKRHLFHLVKVSPWPFVVACSLLCFLIGLCSFMHRVNGGGFLCLLGFFSLVFCGFCWFSDVCEEATKQGYHTLAVRRSLRNGFFLFLASEIMLFFGFFWAFFHSSFNPAIDFSCLWPFAGIDVIPFYGVPFLNTLLLIFSGFSVTWAHRSTALGRYSEVIDSLLITLLLGFVFLFLQIMEYYQATYNFDDSVFACSFYMLTGLHGLHVLVGVCFLSVCFLRFLNKQFSVNHYMGFVFAIWYWHFVDIVWIALFVIIYIWGGWSPEPIVGPINLL